MVDVGGDDGAAAGDLVADELGRHALAQRDELHLGRDLAAPRVVHLGDGAAGPGAEGGAEQGRRRPGCVPGRRPGRVRVRGLGHEFRARSRRVRARARNALSPARIRDRGRIRSPIRGGAAPAGQHLLDVAARQDPLPSQTRQATPYVVGRRPARVVDAQRRLAAGERDLAHRHADAVAALDVHLAGVREGLAVVTGGRRGGCRRGGRRRCGRRGRVGGAGRLPGRASGARAGAHDALLFRGCGSEAEGATSRQRKRRAATRRRGWSGRAGDHRRAPSAGLNRIRFQGSFSIPARAGIPLAAVSSKVAGREARVNGTRRAGVGGGSPTPVDSTPGEVPTRAAARVGVAPPARRPSLLPSACVRGHIRLRNRCAIGSEAAPLRGRLPSCALHPEMVQR